MEKAVGFQLLNLKASIGTASSSLSPIGKGTQKADAGGFAHLFNQVKDQSLRIEEIAVPEGKFLQTTSKPRGSSPEPASELGNEHRQKTASKFSDSAKPLPLSQDQPEIDPSDDSKILRKQSREVPDESNSPDVDQPKPSLEEKTTDQKPPFTSNPSWDIPVLPRQQENVPTSAIALRRGETKANPFTAEPRQLKAQADAEPRQKDDSAASLHRPENPATAGEDKEKIRENRRSGEHTLEAAGGFFNSTARMENERIFRSERRSDHTAVNPSSKQDHTEAEQAGQKIQQENRPGNGNQTVVKRSNDTPVQKSQAIATGDIPSMNRTSEQTETTPRVLQPDRPPVEENQPKKTFLMPGEVRAHRMEDKPSLSSFHENPTVSSLPTVHSQEPVALQPQPQDLPRQYQEIALSAQPRRGSDSSEKPDRKAIDGPSQQRMRSDIFSNNDAFSVEVLKVETSAPQGLRDALKKGKIQGQEKDLHDRLPLSSSASKSQIGEVALATTEQGYQVQRSLEKPAEHKLNPLPGEDRDRSKAERPERTAKRILSAETPPAPKENESNGNSAQQVFRAKAEGITPGRMDFPSEPTQTRKSSPEREPVTVSARGEAVSLPQTQINLQTAPGSAPDTQASGMAKVYADQIAKLQETAAQQIVKGVHGSMGEGRSHVSLQLNPESMGRIFVQMTLTSGQMVAQVHAEKESTRAMVERSINSLKAAFEEQGIKVEKLVVARETFEQNKQDLTRENPDRSRDPRDDTFHRQTEDRSGSERQRQNSRTWAYWTERLRSLNFA